MKQFPQLICEIQAGCIDGWIAPEGDESGFVVVRADARVAVKEGRTTKYVISERGATMAHEMVRRCNAHDATQETLRAVLTFMRGPECRHGAAASFMREKIIAVLDKE